MAASGATPIILYHSTTGAAVPSNTNLSPGELAVNIADMKLYCENDSGVVTLLSSADAAAGNFTTVDINGGTIDGAVIGGSTAAAGSFTTLGASSTATFAAGAVGTPAITTTGDTNTGIFFPAADTIAFAEGGAEAMRIDSSGNVGIGTSSPSVKFEVNGRVLGESVVAGNALYVWSQDRMSLGASYGIESQQSSPFFLLTNSAQPIVFGTNNSERMRIDSSGNVGIGTNAPINELTFGPTTSIISPDTTDGSDSKRLRFCGGGADAVSRGSYVTVYGNEYSGAEGELTLVAGDAVGGNIVFYTGNAVERMRIDSSGNLLVGTTSNSTYPSRGYFVGNATYGGLSVSAPGDGLGYPVYFVDSNATSASQQIVHFDRGSSTVGFITTTNTTTTYSSASDYRLKNTIAPITGALSKVALLKPCTYKWNIDGSEGQGFIAHELQEVCPIAVYGTKDAIDANGNPEYQGVDTSFLVATLTAAIQEQQAIIESLKARLDAANL
jgi:hypothetical protein